MTGRYDAALKQANRNIAVAEHRLYRLVADARKEGYSYADVAKALGVSRQAAWERFHGYVDDAETENARSLEENP